jgi:hypothetical protein
MKRTLFLSFASRRRSSPDYAGDYAGDCAGDHLGARRKRRRTHYQVLGVDVEAEPFVIEAAYRAMMRRAHPDLGGETGHAQLINEAFRVLRDPASRASYDQTLSVALFAQPPLQPKGSPLPRVAATVSRGDGMVSNAYVMLGVVLVAAALLSARESLAGAREVAVAALKPQPFWRAPYDGVARLTLALHDRAPDGQGASAGAAPARP